jgi:hypothetical protein
MFQRVNNRVTLFLNTQLGSLIEKSPTHIRYLLTVAVQYNSIGLINTQYRCDYTGTHAGHVMLQPARVSPSFVFKQSKCKDVFFTIATSVHYRTLPDISFLPNLPECV